MIYTVTFNPSLDYIVSVDDFKLGLTNRTSSELMLPGGKGINVSTVLMNLGIENTALGFTAGFVGEEIPISAQVVSLADVYDALVSERVYKKAFSHEKALEMIQNGVCGTFNPLLLQCMTEAQDKLKTMMEVAEKNKKE